MKKCASCGSINKDDKLSCGVCAASLAGTVSLSLEQAEKIPSPTIRLKAKSRAVGIAWLLSAVGLVVGGVIGIYFISPLGLLLLVTGLLVIMFGASMSVSGIGWGGGSRGGGVNRSRAMKREADRELAEELKRESGEAD